MSIKNVKQHTNIIKEFKSGKKLVEIASKFNITKQRVNQILKINGLEPRKIKQDELNNRVKTLIVNIKKDLKNKTSVYDIIKKYNITDYEISILKNKGVELSRRNEMQILVKKRNETFLKLYKKGYTANEILVQTNSVKTINDIYRGICDVNNGSLPKRLNSTKKNSIKLFNEISRLKKKHTFYDTYKILIDRGFKNSFNNPLRLETVMQKYYKNFNK